MHRQSKLRANKTVAEKLPTVPSLPSLTVLSLLYSSRKFWKELRMRDTLNRCAVSVTSLRLEKLTLWLSISREPVNVLETNCLTFSIAWPTADSAFKTWGWFAMTWDWSGRWPDGSLGTRFTEEETAVIGIHSKVKMTRSLTLAELLWTQGIAVSLLKI